MCNHYMKGRVGHAGNSVQKLISSNARGKGKCKASNILTRNILQIIHCKYLFFVAH